ncbi:glycosyltransferase [Shewanella sp. 3_MG-2023]|uniref:glycosyltransferase family 4 protein n=1 Tax=Shewanella sp. 3_MG-2023 TaxID=3062635 RepID=UPI0026E41F04|nr:glycosyltransferase [Shewanella sp. 3_MG-2023]MDO6776592.1 glycosyltransferase [Shewanella sp. 3_MG-2023]
MSKYNNELLLIGPKQSSDGKIGGIVVLFENLLINLDNNKVKYSVADSNSANYSSKLSMFFYVVRKLITIGTYKHISLNGTAKDYLYFSPVLLVMRFIFRKSYSLRKFAGNFDEYHASLNFLSRFIINTLLKNSSANFFETLSLVQKFKKFNSNTFWFPNVRPIQNRRSLAYCTGEKFKLLFFSQVSTEKGVLDLIDAVKSMDNVELTIAGPISDDSLTRFDKLCPKNVNYVGMIDNDAVYDFISNFHCFILPTYYEGEGYPGAIIEAFMVGLPVISTNWRQIPELVESFGVLVEPKSIDQLIMAIDKVKGDHACFQEKSLERSIVFQDVPNTIKFLNKMGIKHI